MKLWIAGGTSGIGAAVAKKLLVYPGHTTFITGSELDVRSDFKVPHDRIDGLVYSVGTTHLDWAVNQDPEQMLDIINVNAVGLLRCMQAAEFTPADGRPIVVVGSDAAWRPMRTSLAYCASKAALHAMVKVLAREGYWINCVAPGMTEDTMMTEYIDKRVPEVRGWTAEEARDYELLQNPMRRRATPSEIADVVVYQLLRSPMYMRGAIVEVNGGR